MATNRRSAKWQMKNDKWKMIRSLPLAVLTLDRSRAPKQMNRTGVLLINLGTPDAPTPEAVGRYLHEFLMDGYVIDMPAPLRWFVVNVLIVPRRKYQSAEAYQKIQLPEGSPLLAHTRALAHKVAASL